MNRKSLSNKHKRQYQKYSDLCKEFSYKEETVKMKLSSKYLKTSAVVSVDLAFSWQDDVTGIVTVYIPGVHHDTEFIRNLAEPFEKSFQKKIDSLLKKIDKWEAETGLEFDGYC